MAKIYPKKSMNDGYSDEYASSNREIFTVWMKSLVINSNGCTVFNSEGRIVFRVDNYETKSSRETLLMNFHGEVLFSIKKIKKLLIFRSWEGHQWINSMLHKEGIWFGVKKKCNIFGRGLVFCNVILRCKKVTSYLKILGLERKLALKIMDCEDRVIAEVIRKQTSSGVSLGEDVLSLVVEPQ
ncbi:hypothetical protein C2S51_014392, partial [Perilla frutescens var. frutescens]